MSDEEEIVSVHTEESAPPEVESSRDDWRPYHGDLIAKLLLEKVRDATATQNQQKLEEAIQACEQHKLAKHKEVVNGKERLKVITARQRLKEAKQDQQVWSIQSEILKIQEDKALKKELQQDIIEAEQLIAELERRNRVPDRILVLNRKTLSEIRRYFNPPVLMKKTVQASLLLMGESEDVTNDWHICLGLLNPQGKAGMSKRILEFDQDKVLPEISARAKQMLTAKYHALTENELNDTKIAEMSREEREKYVRTMDLPSITQASPAAGAFYVWSMGVIDECEVKNGDEAKPADIKKQRELLVKPDLTPQKQSVYVSPVLKRRYYANKNGPFLRREPQY